MKWRRLIHSCFDPSLQLNRRQKREVWRRARRLPGSPWRQVGLLVLLPVLFFVMNVVSLIAALWIGVEVGVDAMGLVTLIVGCVVVLALANVACAAVAKLYIRWAWRSQILLALHSLGYEVCGRCGYSLRGLDEDSTHCPECGAKREHCVCPHCKTTLPFRGAGGMSCPECGHQLIDAVAEPVSWMIRRLGYLKVDPRLLRVVPRPAWRASRRRALAALRWWHCLRIAVFSAIILAPLVALAYLAGCVALGFHESLWPAGDWIFYISFVAWASAFVGAWAGIGRVYGRPLRRALREEGYEVCVHCGYWLRDLTDRETRCPVCGAQRQPMARSDE
jgi:DNA-directed RNA polymerase subunit RPC12/RpoP